MKSRFVLGLFVLFLSTASWAAPSEWECIHGEIRYLLYLELLTRPAHYCFQKGSNLFVSENCVLSKCLAYPGKTLNTFANGSETSSPSAALCKLKGGQSRVIEILRHEKWIRSDYCYFGEDQSFVSAGLLLKEGSFSP